VQSYEPWSKRGKRDYPEIIAETLNEKWPKDFLGIMAGIPAPMPGCPDAPQEVRDAAVAEFLRTLRWLADQWLDSGKQSAEQPWSRNVDWSSDAYPKPITETLLEFRDRNPPLVVANRDGRFAIFPMGPRKHSSWATMLSECIDPQQHARDLAIAQFVLLLESSCPQRLFRCDNEECAQYFALMRRPREMIKQGTYCSEYECRKQASAKRMESTGDRRRSILVGFAADIWEQWKPDSKHGALEEWVAKQVRKRQRETDKPISRRWVTTHMHRIEAEIRRRKAVSV
jgi:hypothetical protein